jgi:hypothetical protein
MLVDLVRSTQDTDDPFLETAVFYPGGQVLLR